MRTDELSREAMLFGKYILGKNPSAVSVDRYISIVSKHKRLIKTDKALLEHMCKLPWLTGFVDAGLALRRPDSPVRERIHIMFAILEADPAHANRFLPRRFTAKSYIYLALYIIAAGLSGAIGFVLVGSGKK